MVPRPAWLAVGAAAAALSLASVSPIVAMLAAGCGLATAFALVGLGRAKPASVIAALTLGALAIGLRAQALAAAPATAASLPDGDGPWLAVVRSVGAPRAAARPAIVELGTSPPLLVAASLPWYPPVAPSDRVELRGRIRPPPADDYGAYLARIGAAGTIRVERLEIMPAEESLAGTLEGLRRGAAEGLNRAMPEPEAGLAAGVLIGLRDRVDRELAADFTTAGASHVVAISGWNIAIVASTLGALAGRLQRRRRAVLTALAIVAYVVFVGPSPSVVRAGVMAGVALLARELGRPGTAAAALGWAVTALLLVDPAWVDDAGFRLSVLATAGILAWGSSLSDRLSGARPGRLRRWIAEILGVSLAAQAATTPIVLLEFGRLSLVAPAVNLVVVPLVPPAMAAGTLALGAGLLVGAGMPAILAVVAGLPAWILYAAIVGSVRAGASLPLASVELAAPWDLIAAVLSLLAIIAIAHWGNRVLGAMRRVWLTASGRRAAQAVVAGTAAARKHEHGRGTPRSTRLAALLLAGSTIALAVALSHRSDGVVHVTVLDVGQGDGILVEGGRGGRLVIDGGPDPGRLLLALDERLPPWDRRIDILVLTHPHEDHVAGLATILARYRVGRVYEPGMRGPGPGYRAWTAALTRGRPPRGRLATGDQLRIDGIVFRVLWPDPNAVPELPADGGTAINNVSIVLLGEFDGHRILFAGDIEEGIDPELLRRGLPQVDLLKVAHHGSRTASTAPFLAAVHPRVAVVSAGRGNPYGHPAPATIDRLHEVAGGTYRTDTDGSVEITFDGPTVKVHTSGPRNTTAASPGGTAVAARAAAVAPLLCGIRANRASSPVVPEAPPVARAVAGSARTRIAGVGDRVTLPRLPAPVIGAVLALGYHRPHVDHPGAGDGAAPRNGSPRLLLGRRRVRSRRRRRGPTARLDALPGRTAGSLAARGGALRTRPPPCRSPGATRDRLHVRWGQPRDPPRCGGARSEQ